MAVLSKIRQRSVFLIVIIALALFSFVLADVIRNGGFSSDKSQTTIATVNGIDISREDFMERVEAYQRNLGPNANTMQAVNQIWNQELRNTLLSEQFETLGLIVSEDQLYDAYTATLASNPTFQDDAGQFSALKLQEYLSAITANPQAQQQWDDFVETTRQSILQTTYFNLAKSGVLATYADGEEQYRFENDKLDIQFVHIPYSKISNDEVPVSEAEIEAYMRQNPEEFTIEPMVDIQYVSFDEEPSESDVETARAEMLTLLDDQVVYNPVTKANDTLLGLKNTATIQDFINENSERQYIDRWYFKKDLTKLLQDSIFSQSKGFIYGPYRIGNTFNMSKIVDVAQKFDSVNSRHILIRYQGSMRAPSAITRSKEDAQKLADSLLSVLKRTPSKFEALNETFTDDTQNKTNGGELGYFGPGAMVAPFDAFIFGNPEGSIGVVETDFGFHVVKVEDQKNKQRAVKVATLTREIAPSDKTLNDVFAEATKMELAAQDTNFEEAAQAQSLTIKPVNRIGKLDAVIPGVGNQRAIINWAFDASTSTGDIKRFSTEQGYVIAQLTRRNTSKALMSIAEASPTITPILRNQKKAVMLKEAITGTTLQEMAVSQEVTVKSATAITRATPTLVGAGNEPEIVGAAFGLDANEISPVLEGKTGLFIVKVIAKNTAPDIANYGGYVVQLQNAARPKINNAVNTALKEAAKIEDNRANFY